LIIEKDERWRFILEDVLFDGIHEIPNEEVIKKMNYFIEKAEKGMELFENDRKESLKIAKELREELKREYQNNDLIRTSKTYKNHDLFSRHYKPAVQEAFVKNTGQISYKKLHSFLYDVRYYMDYYLPKEEKKKNRT